MERDGHCHPSLFPKIFCVEEIPLFKILNKICRIYEAFILFLVFLFFGCATAIPGKGPVADTTGITDISQGLPSKGLWRENVALVDLDGDGFLDIVVPAPRQAAKEENRPRVFLWNPRENTWREGAFAFPSLAYDYGGIAVGDLNRDGYPDLVIAQHSGRIVVLMNQGGKGFIEGPFPTPESFHSRALEISDVNGDGLPDIIALSEGFPPGRAKEYGILVGINRGGNGWDVSGLKKPGLYGDSITVGNIRGESKDIIAGPLTMNKASKTIFWMGDGKGNFSGYDVDFVGDRMPFIVRAGDVNGDGRDEVVFKLAGVGRGAKIQLAAYKWKSEGFEEMSRGLEAVEEPVVFDLADIDGDGRKELIVLSMTKGLAVYKYMENGWVEQRHYAVSSDYIIGASDLRAGKNNDGSLLVVYNLGSETGRRQGIKAYLLK